MKICQLCNQYFEDNEGKEYKICNNIHVYKCKYCNRDIAITRDSKDWYKRNLVLTRGYTFCDSKCSAKYYNGIRFKEKYKELSEDVKLIYEETSIPKNDIAKQLGITIYTLNKIIEAFNLIRREELKTMMYSDKNKRDSLKLKKSSNYEEYRNKLSDATKAYWENMTEEEKQQRIAKKNNSWKLKSKEQIKDIASKKRKRKTAFDGTQFDSNYEVIVYEYCKRNEIPIECQIPMKLTTSTGEHNIIIDFKIDDLLFECKGGHLLKGIFDEGTVSIQDKIQFYRNNNIIVITDTEGGELIPKPNGTDGGSNGLKYLRKCKDPLIGVDIDLFVNPSIPYADDRPKCFYDVKVDGALSVSEAWSDEKLRWKMIKNRILYSGGFINNKQVLNAMNITRTCKQPSWFSKQLATKIIQTYCTQDIIVDPFAGWGARHDAATKLGRTYIGGDYNEELVKWHQEKGRTVQFCDANEFRYDGVCSVFSCPPYTDPKTGRCFENYNFEGFDEAAQRLTQCGWFKICMKNIPNASEYILVCKIIDPGWEKFVVETITNRSHFGTNYEYILSIPNSAREELLKENT